MSFLSTTQSHTKAAHPGLYWAKFYLSRRTHSYQQIAGLMTVNDLPGMDENVLRTLESEMEFPAVYRPHVPSHGASQTFLRKEGIWEPWARTAPMKQAWSILENKKLRSVVETFLLSPVKPELAVRKICDQEDVKISVKAYDLYRHFFWNTKLMTAASWGSFLQDRRSSHDEWLQLALDARGATGVQMLLWKTGYGGMRQVEANRGFSEAQNAAFFILQQLYMQPPSKAHSEMMLNYLKVAEIAQRGIDASSAAVKDVVESFNAFRMRNIETRAPSIKQLTKGNFSPAEQVDGSEEELDY
jgi:hypothetical protein